MPKVIEVDKTTSRKKLDEELTKLSPKKTPIDLEKYLAKLILVPMGWLIN